MKTTPTKAEEIRKAVIKVVPEIQGGHLFDVGYNYCKYCNEPRLVRERIVHSRIENEGGGSTTEASERTIDTTDHPCPKHFAREIRLADILLAMRYDEVVSRHGVFGKEHNGDVIWNAKGKWDLKNDSLSSQSPETIDFLYSLICGV